MPDRLDDTERSKDDVRQLLAGARTWTEKLAVAIPVYLGPRRRAVAQLRLRDYDADRRRIRFREKGGKIIWKRVPDELAGLNAAAVADRAIGDPDDFLVPPEGHLQRTTGDRDDRVGVDAHVHALRAAFACFYLERNPDDILGLKELLGHRSLNTTLVYLRRLNKQARMERVRSLSWADAVADNGGGPGIPQIAAKWLESSPVMGAGGFEPP